MYLDENHHYLKRDVTERQVKQIIRQTKRLSGEAQDKLSPIVKLTQEKHHAIQKLLALYEPIDINDIPDKQKLNIPFLSNVTQATIEDNYQLMAWSMEDKGTQLIDELMIGAKLDCFAINSIQSGLDYLLPQYQIARENVPRIIKTIQNVTQHYQTVKHHPQTRQFEEQIHEFLDEFIVTLDKSHQIEPYDEALIRLLFDSDYATQLMVGTSLDIRPKVFLTFDDGPNESFTPQVLNILKEHGLRATFFVVGRYVELYPDIAQRIVAEGHEIANHTYNHPDLATISDQEVLEQINRTQDIIHETTGVRPTLYRMPYGSGGERVYHLLPEMTSVTWNTDTGDWYLRNPEAIYENIMTQLSDDILVLLQDTNQDSVDVLEKLIISLKEAHYQLVDPLALDFDYRY